MSAQPLFNEIKETKSLLAVYDQTTGIFSCHKDLIAYFGGPKQGQDLPSFLTQRGIATPNDVQELLSIVDSLNEENPFSTRNTSSAGPVCTPSPSPTQGTR